MTELNPDLKNIHLLFCCCILSDGLTVTVLILITAGSLHECSHATYSPHNMCILSNTHQVQPPPSSSSHSHVKDTPALNTPCATDPKLCIQHALPHFLSRCCQELRLDRWQYPLPPSTNTRLPEQCQSRLFNNVIILIIV